MADYQRLQDMNLQGKSVLLRVDYNVKVKKGKIDDDTRITASLPTIEYLRKHGARVVIMAHLGRPQEELAEGIPPEQVRVNNSILPVAKHLGDLLNRKILTADDWGGPSVKALIEHMDLGDILMLPNLRINAGEESNDPAFVSVLANLCDIYVFDGFGVAHRAHASTTGVPLYLFSQGRGKDVAAGMLMDSELQLWAEARNKKGYKLLVVGGKKLEEKTTAVSKLHKSVDRVLAAGGVYNVIQAGRGVPIGSSLVSEKDTDYTLIGKELGNTVPNLLLAEQVVVANANNPSDYRAVYAADGVPDGYMIADLVVDAKLKAEINKARVIIWFGNLGISDMELKGQYPFARGTEEFKRAIHPEAYVIVGGGDSVTASEGISRIISTGGGAAIKLYTKGTLDALEALKGNATYFQVKQ